MRRAITLAALLLVGCAHAPRRAPPTIPQPMDAYAIPAWNVNGQIVTGCGAGGRACR